jgi:hypothetical protein
MRFSVDFLSNTDILELHDNYGKILEKEATEVFIFIPFALYRSHAIWNLYNEPSDNSYRLHISWLSNRLSIFRETTLKSLRSQEYTGFKIVFLLDQYSGDPTIRCWLQKRLREMTEGCSSRKISCDILLCDFNQEQSPNKAYPRFLAPIIRKYLIKNSSRPNLLLYRLDSDDMLLQHNISDSLLICSQLADRLSANRPYLIDFPYGMQCNLSTGECFYTLWPEGTFASLYLRSEWLLNGEVPVPFEYPHDKVPEIVRRICVATHVPAWSQGIHGDNIMNEIFPWSIKSSLESPFMLIQDKETSDN